jgi:2-C-methyl-D-erythritol 4-phosphate cytidylyltransferase
VKLCAILPLPASVARHRESVFTLVEGRPVLWGMVRALAAAVGEVLVTADDQLIDDVRACLAGLPVQVIAAGESPDTAGCLAAAAAHLQLADATHVLVADHRYPVIPPALVARVVGALTDGAELAIPVLPVTDTVKRVDGQGVIQSTVDRAELRITQYPFGANVQRLSDLDIGFGAAGLITVAGDADAVRIELPEDVALLEAIIDCRH